MDLSGRPSLMLFICQDKPIPLVRFSLSVNSFICPLFFVPPVYQFWKKNRRAVMSAYINIFRSVLFLMLLWESALKFYGFLWEAAPTENTLLAYYDKLFSFFFFFSQIHISEILTNKQTQPGKDFNAIQLHLHVQCLNSGALLISLVTALQQEGPLSL